MKVTVSALMECEEDGYNGSVNMSRGDIKKATELAQLFCESARALGFSYVDSVAFQLDDDTILWSDG